MTTTATTAARAIGWMIYYTWYIQSGGVRVIYTTVDGKSYAERA